MMTTLGSSFFSFVKKWQHFIFCCNKKNLGIFSYNRSNKSSGDIEHHLFSFLDVAMSYFEKKNWCFYKWNNNISVDDEHHSVLVYYVNVFLEATKGARKF
jgi:hypothetical protein